MPRGTGVASVIRRSSNQDGQHAARVRIALHGQGVGVCHTLVVARLVGRVGEPGTPLGAAAEMADPAAFAVLALQRLGHCQGDQFAIG